MDKTCLYHWVKKASEIRSIGGDGTYLRTSGLIETPEIPILGLNTDPTRSTG